MINFKNIALTKIMQKLYSLIIILGIFVFCLMSIFLYYNFYSIASKIKKILILQEEVANEVVDIDKFNEIIEKLDKKTTLRELKDINNPFE